MMEIKALNHYEQSTAESAVESRADKLNWYVLKYDTVSTEYNNTIEFKTLSDAWEEFQRTDSSYPNERIELIFSPYEDDDEFEAWKEKCDKWNNPKNSPAYTPISDIVDTLFFEGEYEIALNSINNK